MIKYENIFNNQTLNIFTDASIRPLRKEYVGAPGFVAVIGDNVVKRDVRILRESTNNESELYSIYMAVQYALQNRDKVTVINIFSDSKFSIYGLREWMFKWVNNIKFDELYNSSNKPVSNQSIFLAILYTILEYNLKINLYHVRGHFTQFKVNQFIHIFSEYNFLSEYIDKRAALKMIECNNDVDLYTRKALYIDTLPSKLILPQYVAREDIDMEQYKELLNL